MKNKNNPQESKNNQRRGLTTAQAEESLRLHGANVLTPPAKQSIWRLLIEKFKDPLIEILLVALVLSFGVSAYEISIGMGMKSLLEPVGILTAVLLATVVGFLVEVNANKKFEILNKVNDEVAVKVLRDGKVRRLSRQKLVVGDVVMLDTGEEVPADGVLLSSNTLRINESTLTGEPMVHKSHKPEENDPEATYPTNELLRGTTVIEGHCSMLVTRVGDATEYGKVYTASQIDNGVKTPLMMQLERLGRTISWLGYGAAILLFVGRVTSYILVDDTWNMLEFVEYMLTTVMLAVTLIVVSVPEGLPMSVTLSLALSMRRMLNNNNLVRKMHACETMGSTTVICTDKTGTLTQNCMQVFNAEFFALGDKGLGDDVHSNEVREAIAINSTAFIEDDGVRKQALGNPTEGALLLWLAEQGDDYMKLRGDAVVVSQLPFSTERKFMATVVDSPLLGCRMLYVKGASEILYNYCSSTAADVDRTVVREHLLAYQQKAMRTLGFACKRLEPDEDPIVKGQLNVSGMTFMGIVAISDPVRSDVPQSIKECVDAGIKVKIVTGDTPGTAREIARQVGILNNDDDDATALISGPDFAALPDDDACQAAAKLKVMSRARPQDKSRLVTLLQKQGEVVAVTGDGTNDAPALNAAQVGLSMGDGTSVAKEASDITIIDNSFASITKAVLWGRSLYLNIQRFVVFQLTVNVIACVVVTLGSFLGKQPPLSVTQMLWVNLIMDTFAALAMALLPATQRVMKARPRKQGAPIITHDMWTFIVGFGSVIAIMLSAYLLYLKCTDADGFFAFSFAHDIEPHELTKFFTAFVFVQFWNMLNARSFFSGHHAFYKFKQSRVFFAMWAIIFVGQVLISRFGGEFFKLNDLAFSEIMPIALVTSVVAVVGQIIFYIKRK
ncbi:MAG: calcium-translocating P-type ATPase, PMCA-type [Muribaculaceae bacterium]